jgi:hypothetical protein
LLRAPDAYDGLFLLEQGIRISALGVAIAASGRILEVMVLVIYVGDARDVVKRVRSNHCRSNVEASALRQYIAVGLGFSLARTARTTGTTRIRIDLLDPSAGEAQVSAYISGGAWRYVLCESYGEAADFQWFVIAQFDPLLNRDRRPWDAANETRYRALLAQLENAPLFTCAALKGQPTGPGVYVLYHEAVPVSLESQSESRRVASGV